MSTPNSQEQSPVKENAVVIAAESDDVAEAKQEHGQDVLRVGGVPEHFNEPWKDATTM
jgi:hypothetical protein